MLAHLFDPDAVTPRVPRFDIRLGGIYALESTARDSDVDRPTVVEVLAAFVHRYSNGNSRPYGAATQSTWRRPSAVYAMPSALL